MTPHISTAEATIVLPWPHKDLSPNARVVWQAKMRRASSARQTAWGAALAAGVRHMPGEGSVRVTTTFLPPDRRTYDEDNLKARMKSSYDGISDALGIDDRHFRHGPVEIGEPVKGGEVRIRIEVGA